MCSKTAVRTQQTCPHALCIGNNMMETSASRRTQPWARGPLTLCLQQVLHHLLQADQVDEFVVGSAGPEVQLRGRGFGWGDFKQRLLQLFAQCKLGGRLPTRWRIRSSDHGGHAAGGGVGLSRGGCRSFQRCWGGLWGGNDLVRVPEGPPEENPTVCTISYTKSLQKFPPGWHGQLH